MSAPELDEKLRAEVEEGLKAIDEEISTVEEELEKMQHQKMLPIFEKRRAIFAKIPQFWPTALFNHPALGEILDEADKPVIESLTDIWIERNPKSLREFKVIFSFSKNDFFTNEKLVKEIVLEDEEQVAKPFTIDWKAGKDLTKSTKRKHDESESFFAWFNNEDTMLAEVISEDFFPEAWNHFNNEGGFEGDEDEDDDEGSVDLDDEEEDEDEENEQPPQKKNKK